jgi:3-oxoacyl-[acyl-carrier protein] reductase
MTSENLFDLTGKTALVTGAARGMGKGIALRLAASGALVAIADAKPAEETIAAIQAQGGQAFHVQAEIGPPGGAETMVADLDKALRDRTGQSGLDILVNNIGGGHYQPFATTSPDLLDWTIGINIRVPFLITQALLPRLNQNGRVINISSAGARLPNPDIMAYGMCKAAINYFTRALAKELGPSGITVNAVSPGTTNIETNWEMLKNPELARAIAADTLLGRIGQPNDIADVVLALVSPACRWVTGQNIEASGGYKL